MDKHPDRHHHARPAEHRNFKHPNFRVNGQLYLVRCFEPVHGKHGRENWAVAVATGTCHVCGWNENNSAHAPE